MLNNLSSKASISITLPTATGRCTQWVKILRALSTDSDGMSCEPQDNLSQPEMKINSRISTLISTDADWSNLAQIDSKLSRAFSIETNGSNFESEAFDLFHCLSEGSDNLSIEVSQFGLCCNPGPLFTVNHFQP